MGKQCLFFRYYGAMLSHDIPNGHKSPWLRGMSQTQNSPSRTAFHLEEF
jgi:hypothetical protein